MPKSKDKILETYIRDEDIKKIIEIIKSKPIKRTPHFYERLISRDISEDLADKTINQYDKVKVIDKRLHVNEDIGYDLYYTLSNTRTLKLGFIIKKDVILLCNVFLLLQRWQSFIRPLNPRH